MFFILLNIKKRDSKMLIQGIVVDKETNLPIPFIAVKLDNLETPLKENIRDFTNPDGAFGFNVPNTIIINNVERPATYQLEIRSPVHSPFTEKIFRDTRLTIRIARITI